MSTLELNTYKLELLRQIMNEFNTEASLRRLAAACRLIHQEEEQQWPAMIYIIFICRKRDEPKL